MPKPPQVTRVTLLPALEVDAAQTVTRLQLAHEVSLSPALEANSALGLTKTKTIVKQVSPAAETDLAARLPQPGAKPQRFVFVL